MVKEEKFTLSQWRGIRGLTYQGKRALLNGRFLAMKVMFIHYERLTMID